MDSVAALQQYSSYSANSGGSSTSEASDSQFQDILNQSVNKTNGADKTAGKNDGKQSGKDEEANSSVSTDKGQGTDTVNPEDAAKAALNMLLNNGVFQNLLVQAQPEQFLQKDGDGIVMDGQIQDEPTAQAAAILAEGEQITVQESSKENQPRQTDGIPAEKLADTEQTEVPDSSIVQKQAMSGQTEAKENDSRSETGAQEIVNSAQEKTVETTAPLQSENVKSVKTEEAPKLQDVSTETAAQAAAAVQSNTVNEAVRNPQAVQTAEPAQQANTEQKLQVKTPEELPEKVTENLQEALRTGKQELTLKLEPEHLGKLIIKASYENGRAVVSIACTSEKAMQVLASRAMDMANIMENNLGTPTNIVVDKSETDYLKQQNENGKSKKDGREGQNEQQNNRNREQESIDFLQQLRLGIV